MSPADEHVYRLAGHKDLHSPGPTLTGVHHSPQSGYCNQELFILALLPPARPPTIPQPRAAVPKSAGTALCQREGEQGSDTTRQAQATWIRKDTAPDTGQFSQADAEERRLAELEGLLGKTA